ncbi:MAG: FtsL-like putative cell division protein [Solirubrobacteraceae bacterium]
MKKKAIHKEISITDILKGKFLIENNAPRAWGFLLFIMFLAFISIYSSHLVDKKVVEIRKIKDSLRELNSESAFIHQKLMQKKMLIDVEKKVEIYGLKKPDKNLYKLTKVEYVN